MKTYIFEGIQHHGTPLNWGKFMVAIPDVEWFRDSQVDPGGRYPLLERIGWTQDHIWVMDLQTGEAAWFRHGGNARADLEKHRIWVCPLFEEFLKWLYTVDLQRLHQLPGIVELPSAQFSINGYRRPGPHDVTFTLRKGDLLQIEWAGDLRPVICEGFDETGNAMIRSLTSEEVAQMGKHTRPPAPEPEDQDAAANTAQRAAQTGLENTWEQPYDDAALRDMTEQLAHEEQVAAEEGLSEDDIPTQVTRSDIPRK